MSGYSQQNYQQGYPQQSYPPQGYNYQSNEPPPAGYPGAPGYTSAPGYNVGYRKAIRSATKRPYLEVYALNPRQLTVLLTSLFLQPGSGYPQYGGGYPPQQYGYQQQQPVYVQQQSPYQSSSNGCLEGMLVSYKLADFMLHTSSELH